MMGMSTDAFLIALVQIIAIDIVLGGDNAIIIALACRNLPPKQKRLGIIWGAAGAIILRVILVFFASAPDDAKAFLFWRQVATGEGDNNGIVATKNNVDCNNLHKRNQKRVRGHSHHDIHVVALIFVRLHLHHQTTNRR